MLQQILIPGREIFYAGEEFDAVTPTFKAYFSLFKAEMSLAP